MKKIIAILMALMLLLAGCSGGEKPLSGTVEQAPGVTEADESSTVETAAPTEEEQVSLGRMEGGVYTNSYAGFGCELDSNWAFYTAEELQELPANVAELFADSELLNSETALNQITDMMAENANDLTSINVLYTKLSTAERLCYATMTNEEILDLALAEQKDTIVSAYEQAGFEVDSMEKVTVTFLGKECAALHSALSIDGIAYYTLQIFNYKVGQYGITTTLSSYLEDNTSNLLGLFYAVE